MQIPRPHPKFLNQCPSLCSAKSRALDKDLGAKSLSSDPSSALVGVSGRETGKEGKTNKRYTNYSIISVGEWVAAPRGSERP